MEYQSAFLEYIKVQIQTTLIRMTCIYIYLFNSLQYHRHYVILIPKLQQIHYNQVNPTTMQSQPRRLPIFM